MESCPVKKTKMSLRPFALQALVAGLSEVNAAGYRSARPHAHTQPPHTKKHTVIDRKLY